ncbi:MAG: FHA domain-containing protein [Myxococcales bacterium]|nr:FHA domain-containing protein [Myxococcales bacterium]
MARPSKPPPPTGQVPPAGAAGPGAPEAPRASQVHAHPHADAPAGSDGDELGAAGGDPRPSGPDPARAGVARGAPLPRPDAAPPRPSAPPPPPGRPRARAGDERAADPRAAKAPPGPRPGALVRQAPARAPGPSDRSPGPGPKGLVVITPIDLARARVLEHGGEHAQAAVLRLEYAHTLCGTVQRIAMLREGCARNSGATEEGRALHQALAEALLRHAEFMEDGAPRRAILMEAARALEEADQGAVAGEIYERLGMIRRAARAYERAGAVSQLEYTLGLLERHEQVEAELQGALQTVDAALREGRRLLAHSLLQEHVHDQRPQLGPAQHAMLQARAGFVQRLQAIAAAAPRGPRITLRWPGGSTGVLMLPRLRLGRAPDVELPLPGALLSREHAELRVVRAGATDLAVAAFDLGSRAGSFWRGEPLEPGEPALLEEVGELGLGLGTAVDVHPLRRDQGELGALVRARGAGPWLLFLPEGGPVWLTPERALPLRLDLRPPFIGLTVAPGVAAHLGSEPLGVGASVELLIGDRLHLALPEGRFTLEVG